MVRRRRRRRARRPDRRPGRRASPTACPGIVDDANAELSDLQDWLDDNGIDVEVAEQGKTALETLGARVTEGSGELVSFTREAVTTIIEGSIALILIIVLSVYMLLYGERIGAAVRSVVPRGNGTPEDDYPTRVQRAVFGYVRGQLLFSVIMGTSAGVMLWVAGSLGVFPDGQTYALAFGAFFGFAELIPYVGPAIGAAPPMVVALFSDNPVDALWLAIMFTVLQQIEGHIVAPTVFSQALRINPLLVIFALLIGRPAVRVRRRVPRAAARRRAARERRLLPRAPRARAVARRRPPRSCGSRARPPHATTCRRRAPLPGVRHARRGRRGRTARRAARSSPARTRPLPPPRPHPRS